MMVSAGDTVSAFIALWEEPEGFPCAVERYFTDATVWENHGLLTTTGKREAIGFYEQFGAATGMKGMKIAILALAESGDKVLTERIDYILDGDGRTVMTVPVMGIFEITGGKIAAWRDYFDTVANAPPAAG
jgi:limonene-1,2-epoxide hydrolase